MLRLNILFEQFGWRSATSARALSLPSQTQMIPYRKNTIIIFTCLFSIIVYSLFRALPVLHFDTHDWHYDEQHLSASNADVYATHLALRLRSPHCFDYYKFAGSHTLNEDDISIARAQSAQVRKRRQRKQKHAPHFSSTGIIQEEKELFPDDVPESSRSADESVPRRMRTFEDWAFNETNDKKWIWFGSQIRLVKAFIKSKDDDFSRKVRFPFIPKSGSSLLRYLVSALGVMQASRTPESVTQVGPDTPHDYNRVLSAAFVRDPMSRLASAYRTMIDLGKNYRTEPDQAGCRPWLCQDGNSSKKRFDAFLEDVFNGVYVLESSHVWTQSYYLSATTSRAGHVEQVPIDFLAPTDQIQRHWDRFEELVGASVHQKADVNICFHGCDRERFFFDHSWWTEENIFKLCYIYAQDYVCLGYILPKECRSKKFDKFAAEEDERRGLVTSSSSFRRDSLVKSMKRAHHETAQLLRTRCESSADDIDLSFGTFDTADLCALRSDALRLTVTRGVQSAMPLPSAEHRRTGTRAAPNTFSLTHSVSSLNVDRSDWPLLRSSDISDADNVIDLIDENMFGRIKALGGVYRSNFLTPDWRIAKFFHVSSTSSVLEVRVNDTFDTLSELGEHAIRRHSTALRIAEEFSDVLTTAANSVIRVQIINNRVYSHVAGLLASDTSKGEAVLSRLYSLCRWCDEMGVRLPDVEFQINVDDHYETRKDEKDIHMDENWFPIVFSTSIVRLRDRLDYIQLPIPGWELSDFYIDEGSEALYSSTIWPETKEEMEVFQRKLRERVSESDKKKGGVWRGHLKPMYTCLPGIWNDTYLGNSIAKLVQFCAKHKILQCRVSGSTKPNSIAIKKHLKLLTALFKLREEKEEQGIRTLRHTIHSFIDQIVRKPQRHIDTFDMHQWKVIVDLDTEVTRSDKLTRLTLLSSPVVAMAPRVDFYSSRLLERLFEEEIESGASDDVAPVQFFPLDRFDTLLAMVDKMIDRRQEEYERRVRGMNRFAVKYYRGESLNAYWALLLTKYAPLQRFEAKVHALSAEYIPCSALTTRRACLCRRDSSHFGHLHLGLCKWLSSERRCVLYVVPHDELQAHEEEEELDLLVGINAKKHVMYEYDGADQCRLDAYFDQLHQRIVHSGARGGGGPGARTRRHARRGALYAIHERSLEQNDLERACRVLFMLSDGEESIPECLSTVRNEEVVREQLRTAGLFEVGRADTSVTIGDAIHYDRLMSLDRWKSKFHVIVARRIFYESGFIGIVGRARVRQYLARLVDSLACGAQLADNERSLLIFAWITGISYDTMHDYEIVEYLRNERQLRIEWSESIGEFNFLEAKAPFSTIGRIIPSAYRYVVASRKECN